MTEHVARVESVWKETGRLLGMKLAIESEIAASHQRPGQYLVLKDHDHKPVMLAIASAPRAASPFELLLGPEAQRRLPNEAGHSISIGHAQGVGFPVEKAEGCDVLAFAVGTGLSAVRPLLAEIAARRSAFRRVVLYMGAKTWDEQPYRRLDADWNESGIEVRRSVGRPWVQDLFLQEPLPLGEAFAFVCGMPEMIKGVKTTLFGAGLAPDRVGVNW